MGPLNFPILSSMAGSVLTAGLTLLSMQEVRARKIAAKAAVLNILIF